MSQGARASGQPDKRSQQSKNRLHRCDRRFCRQNRVLGIDPETARREQAICRSQIEGEHNLLHLRPTAIGTDLCGRVFAQNQHAFRIGAALRQSANDRQSLECGCFLFLEMDQQFINRYLNEGFSGGEKKRMEILQMLMLKPGFAVMDETDSGLDIDALKVVSKGVNHLRSGDFGALIITHYQRILQYVTPDFVHVMYNGRVVTSGGEELAHTLEAEGYDWVRQKYGAPEDVLEEAT